MNLEIKQQRKAGYNSSSVFDFECSFSAKFRDLLTSDDVIDVLICIRFIACFDTNRDVRTADPSADGRRSAASRTATSWLLRACLRDSSSQRAGKSTSRRSEKAYTQSYSTQGSTDLPQLMPIRQAAALYRRRNAQSTS